MKATEVNHPTVTSEAPDRRVGGEGTTAGERERARLERLSLYVRTAQTIVGGFRALLSLVDIILRNL